MVIHTYTLIRLVSWILVPFVKAQTLPFHEQLAPAAAPSGRGPNPTLIEIHLHFSKFVHIFWWRKSAQPEIVGSSSDYNPCWVLYISDDLRCFTQISSINNLMICKLLYSNDKTETHFKLCFPMDFTGWLMFRGNFFQVLLQRNSFFLFSSASRWKKFQPCMWMVWGLRVHAIQTCPMGLRFFAADGDGEEIFGSLT